MLDIENQLRKYGEAVEEAALVAPSERPMSSEGQLGNSETERRRTPMLVALAASAVLLVGGAIYLRQSPSETVDAASGNTASASPTSEDTASASPTSENPAAPIKDEWADYAVPAYVSDGLPDGMTVQETISAADNDAPAWTLSSQLYWVEGKTVPDETDEQLSISWFADDASDGGLYGEPATIRGTEGVIQDGAVMFADNGFRVRVTSSTFSTDELLALAEQLTITETGVQPLDDVPGGLTALPVRTSSSYTQHGATVPSDGHTVTYLDGDRSLNIFSLPSDGSEQAVLWRGGGRQIDVAGRQVWIRSIDDHFPASVEATWIEGDTQIAILALGLSEEEVLPVIAATRPASKTEW